jgi:GWxTD domain-containing protein
MTPSVHRVARCLLLALVLCLGTAVAQSSTQREALGAFRDSLGGVSDSFALLALEKQMIAEARRDRDSAMVHLRLGLLSLRLGDLGGPKHYNDAASEFQWATSLQPEWPYGWFGLGLAELGVGDSEVSVVAGLQTMLGKDALTRSANAFAKSAEVDPSFVVGLVELSNTALRQLVNTRMDVALAALRRASRTSASAHPDVLLARARVERLVGSPDSALVAGEALLQRLPRDPAGLLEVARARFVLGRLDGGDPFYRGLALADGEVLAAYRRDLAMVMPDSVLQQVDAADGTARADRVRQFFAQRDRDAMHPAGARLREHYARLDHAHRNFRLVSRNRQYNIEERFRSTQEEFDDRGVIWVRHGAPDQRLQHNLPEFEPNESWRYRREDGDLIFHFVSRQDVQDFRLVESLFDILGFRGAMVVQDSGDVNAFANVEALARSREPLSPLYSRMLASGRGGGSMLQTEERAAGRRAIAIGTTTDSWPLRFPRTLDGTIFVAAAGADAAGPRIQLAFAVPAAALAPDSVEGGKVHVFRMRASVLAEDGAVVATLDTVRRILSRELVPAGEQLLARAPIRVPPGQYTIRASLEHGDAGLVSRRDTVRVADPNASALSVADLIVGSRNVRLFWIAADGDTTWLNPLARFRRDTPAQVTLEIAGLAPGAPYRVEVRVIRPGGGGVLSRLFGGGAALRVAFDGIHPGGLATVRRELALDEIKPGTYLLEVTVTANGAREMRRQELTVVK